MGCAEGRRLLHASPHFSKGGVLLRSLTLHPVEQRDDARSFQAGIVQTLLDLRERPTLRLELGEVVVPEFNRRVTGRGRDSNLVEQARRANGAGIQTERPSRHIHLTSPKWGRRPGRGWLQVVFVKQSRCASRLPPRARPL